MCANPAEAESTLVGFGCVARGLIPVRGWMKRVAHWQEKSLEIQGLHFSSAIQLAEILRPRGREVVALVGVGVVSARTRPLASFGVLRESGVDFSRL